MVCYYILKSYYPHLDSVCKLFAQTESVVLKTYFR